MEGDQPCGWFRLPAEQAMIGMQQAYDPVRPRPSIGPSASSVPGILWNTLRAWRMRASLSVEIALTRRSQASARRRIAIVSWAFPPSGSSSGHLPSVLARVAVRSDWDAAVLCAPAPVTLSEQGTDMLDQLPSSVAVIRAAGAVDDRNDSDFRVSYALLPALDGGFQTALLLADAGRRGLAAAPPGVVLAAGPRFANFVAGAWLARLWSAKFLPLYQDEWTVETPPFVQATESDARWERHCLQRADGVLYVTEGKRRAYQARFPFLASKPSAIVPNGWDPLPFERARAGTHYLAEFGDKFVLAFVGTAAPHAPILPFLENLDALLTADPGLKSRLQLLLVGSQPPEVSDAIARLAARHGDVAKIWPPVPQTVAVEIMMESDALLLLLNTRYPGIVPQKSYDYLRSGAPVLVFGDTSEIARTIDELGAGIIVPESDPTVMRAALNRMMTAHRDTFNTETRRSWIARYNREAVCSRILDFADGLWRERSSLMPSTAAVP